MFKRVTSVSMASFNFSRHTVATTQHLVYLLQGCNRFSRRFYLGIARVEPMEFKVALYKIDDDLNYSR